MLNSYLCSLYNVYSTRYVLCLSRCHKQRSIPKFDLKNLVFDALDDRTWWFSSPCWGQIHTSWLPLSGEKICRIAGFDGHEKVIHVALKVCFEIHQYITFLLMLEHTSGFAYFPGWPIATTTDTTARYAQNWLMLHIIYLPP